MRRVRTVCRVPSRRYATATVKLPSLGLGTWKSQKEAATTSVKTAIELGYRHIGSAFFKLPRLLSKIPHSSTEMSASSARPSQNRKSFRGSSSLLSRSFGTRCTDLVCGVAYDLAELLENVVAACDQSLRDLGLKYLDLYLIHWPVTMAPGSSPYPRRADGSWIIEEQHPITETWEAMEELVAAGKTKAIGVCNFAVEHLKELLADCKIKPACNQFEMHPYLPQRELVQFCKDKDIQVTAYSSLGNLTQPQGGVTPLLQHPVVISVAEANKRTPAQVLLRWAVQKGAAVIPKSTNPERIKENAGVRDFALSDSDMARLDGLENGTRFVKPEWAFYMQ